jgi:hypothetical protein
MTIEAVKEFYTATFEDETLQKKLLEPSDVEDFIKTAVEVGRENGYEFDFNEMQSTMDGYGPSKSFEGIEMESEWIRKIMEMGWVPLGYSR